MLLHQFERFPWNEHIHVALLSNLVIVLKSTIAIQEIAKLVVQTIHRLLIFFSHLSSHWLVEQEIPSWLQWYSAPVGTTAANSSASRGRVMNVHCIKLLYWCAIIRNENKTQKCDSYTPLQVQHLPDVLCIFFYLTYSAGFDRQLDSTHMNRSAEEVSSIFIFFFRI